MFEARNLLTESMTLACVELDSDKTLESAFDVYGESNEPDGFVRTVDVLDKTSIETEEPRSLTIPKLTSILSASLQD